MISVYLYCMYFLYIITIIEYLYLRIFIRHFCFCMHLFIYLVLSLYLLVCIVITVTPLPYAGTAVGNRLYSTDHNYMDFNVDEVGLWVIYSTYDSNNTLVAKVSYCSRFHILIYLHISIYNNTSI